MITVRMPISMQNGVEQSRQHGITTEATQPGRLVSAPSTASGSYTISLLPPGTDEVAFQVCADSQSPFVFSNPVTIVAGTVTTLNYTMSPS